MLVAPSPSPGSGLKLVRSAVLVGIAKQRLVVVVVASMLIAARSVAVDVKEDAPIAQSRAKTSVFAYALPLGLKLQYAHCPCYCFPGA